MSGPAERHGSTTQPADDRESAPVASKTYDLRQNRAACFVAFGVQGFSFSLLVSRVPAIQKHLAIDDGTLSILLAVVPIVAGVGSVLAGLAMRWMTSSLLLRIA